MPVPGDSALRVDTIMQQIKAKGGHVTMQRRLVVEALCASGGHPTIADIERHLQQQGMSISETTIYRILESLKDLQMVSPTDMGASGIVYSLLDTPPHHHGICLDCGAIFDLDDSYFADLRQRLDDNLGFQARIDHMAIYGLCRQCAQQAASKE